MTNSQIKGRRYMLDVCRLLSHWIAKTKLSDPAHALAFRTRSTSIMPVEGHWMGQGDLVHRPGLYFPFCVECKNDEHGKLDSILEAPKWSVWTWWEQARTQAQKVSSTPLLIFSRSQRENYVLMETRVAQRLEVGPKRAPLLEVHRVGGEELTLCLLDDLMRVTPGRLRCISTVRMYL